MKKNNLKQTSEDKSKVEPGLNISKVREVLSQEFIKDNEIVIIETSIDVDKVIEKFSTKQRSKVTAKENESENKI